MSDTTDNEKPHGVGYTRLFRAFWCSMAGIRAAWNNEAAFRQEVLLCMPLIPLAVVCASTGLELALLLSSLLLILMVEILNSAIEAAIDRVGPERHPFSKLAKDLGSAAVFFSLVNGGVVWLCILLW